MIQLTDNLYSVIHKSSFETKNEKPDERAKAVLNQTALHKRCLSKWNPSNIQLVSMTRKLTNKKNTASLSWSLTSLLAWYREKLRRNLNRRIQNLLLFRSLAEPAIKQHWQVGKVRFFASYTWRDKAFRQSANDPYAKQNMNFLKTEQAGPRKKR